jgi:hypothetical protein
MYRAFGIIVLTLSTALAQVHWMWWLSACSLAYNRLQSSLPEGGDTLTQKCRHRQFVVFEWLWSLLEVGKKSQDFWGSSVSCVPHPTEKTFWEVSLFLLEWVLQKKWMSVYVFFKNWLYFLKLDFNHEFDLSCTWA